MKKMKVLFSKFLGLLVISGLLLGFNTGNAAYAQGEDPSTQTTIYHDEVTGFELDYPATWAVSEQTLLEGGQTQVIFTRPDETVISLTISSWDLADDLNAYASSRKDAWAASGVEVLSEDAMSLTDGRPAIRFLTQSETGEQTFSFFTSFGYKYLELAGSGETDLLTEVSSTVRPIAVSAPAPIDTATLPPAPTATATLPPAPTATPAPTDTATLAPAPTVDSSQAGQQSGGSDGADTSGASIQASAGSLGKLSAWTVRGGYVAGGTAMRNLGRGNITIQGIPSGAVVQKAYLYWNVISTNHTAANASGVFNGYNITGSFIAATSSPCWGSGYASRTYRADVTTKVSANNITYPLTGFASGTTSGQQPDANQTAPLLEGASLVIIYANFSYPITTILLYNGAVRTSTSVGYAETTMSAIPAYPSYLAYTTYIVADGQTYTDVGASFNGSLVTADLDGTDPKITGGRYTLGNLWDTDNASGANTAGRGISVGAKIPANSTSVKVRVDGGTDCLVHVAQVLSVSNGQSDTDGDGLLDSWEGNGYLTQNLPAAGANPFHKDIFLEVDWMADAAGEFSHKPNATVVAGMVASFAGGDVVNPDRKPGVALHVDVSNSIPHSTEFTSTVGCGDLFTKLETTKTANMVAARYKIYHYQLWVHDLCPDLGSTSGYAQDIPGDDSFVSLGSWGSQGTTNQRIGTGLHELGHTLNLRHGYPTGVSPAGNGGSDDPYTPNHLSVMSYIYQTDGLIMNGAFGKFDYQRWNLPALNESCLNESNGVGSLSALDVYGLRWYTSGGVGHQNLTNGSANGPVDWNSSSATDACASVSINNDADLETLNATRAEWGLLVYNGGAVGLGAEYGLNADGEVIPVLHIDPATFKELTFEEAQVLNVK